MTASKENFPFMKKWIFILLFFLSNSTFGNCLKYNDDKIPSSMDTTVLQSILSINLNYYIGKPVDSLLSVLPTGFSDRGFMPVGAGYAKGVYQSYSTSYSNNCFVEIYIDNFQFLPIPNLTPTTTWNMNLAKKETVAFIKVIKNNNICVYGCNNPNYYD